MSLSVRQLNADASFLLTFEPQGNAACPYHRQEPFTVLTDPWITGPSKIFHPILALTHHRTAACISSLCHLPEPDLVIISQQKSDHCNEATLRQLPPSGTKTRILAVPAAARLIRSWNYFDKSKIITIPRWEESSREIVVRIQVSPFIPGSQPGEVTVAFLQQKRDISGLHSAIGITYRPPLVRRPFPRGVFTPPATPNSTRFPNTATSSPTAQALLLTPPTPPSSPHPTRSIRPTRSTNFHRGASQHLAPNPALSVLFSPHGISYRDLEPYVKSHLALEAALPLTALLHCFDSVSNPWWLGGNISSGVPAGQKTALALNARAWVSAHDGDKDISGLMTKRLRARRYAREEVLEVLAPREKRAVGEGYSETEVLMLGTGEEIVLSHEGLVSGCSKR
ncbi:hypothetical protein jhhlp_002352 [Lomentospora prolificans]|uniref:Metallo-beta-lactamase domain-containing protein n=1 Tax=Lomentospora prolificans TaxID=41688 RepID=A0A2N3NDU6_9PEZI|nr:hypothetical protein jhhlp_002352 [Lomentospora prolificans]